MRRWLLLAWALSACALSGQTLVPVVAVWDAVTGEHHESATWELERDGAIYPCALTSVTETERRCTASVPAGTATFRLRGVTTGAGPWSTAVVATVAPPQPGEPPGAFVLQWHRRFTAAQEPSEMATIVQSASNTNGSGSATSLAATFTSPVTSGRTLLARFNVYNGASTVTSVTDTASNTWTLVGSRRSDGDNQFSIWEFACANATGGSSFTVTGHFSTGVYVGMAIHEVHGGAVIGSAFAYTGISSGTASGAPITPDADGIHVASLSYENVGATVAPSGGWSEVIEVDEPNDAGAVLVASRAAVDGVMQTPSWSISVSGSVLISHVVIAEPSGGGGDDHESAADMDIPAPTLAAGVSVSRTVSASMALAAPALSASGAVVRAASATMQAPAPTLAASAGIVRDTAGALSVPTPTLAATGSVARTASGALTLSVPELGASIGVARSVAGALEIAPLELAAVMGGERTASGSLSLPPPVLSAASVRVLEASATMALPVPAVTAAASIVRFADGELALAVPLLSALSFGAGHAVTAALTLPVPVLDADVLIARAASADLRLTLPALDASTLRLVAVDGALVLRAPTLEGQATIGRLASGTLDVPALRLLATSVVGTLQPVVLHRADVVALTPTRDVVALTPIRTVEPL